MRWLPLLLLTLALPLMPSWAADAPKGKIAYAMKDGERYSIHIMNADGTGDRELPGQTANVNILPQWSPDGKRIAYTTGSSFKFEDFQVAVCIEDGSGLKSFNGGMKVAAMPAWSPDGKRLAFAAGDAAPAIYVADPDGNGFQKVSEEEGAALFPFWSTDGKSVAFTKLLNGEQKSEVVMKTLDGGAVETLISGEKVHVAVPGGLSADGKRLLFSTIDPPANMATVKLWDIGGKSESLLQETKIEPKEGLEMLVAPAWAQGGKSYLISLPSDSGCSVFLISEDGKEKKKVSPEGKTCVTPSWFGG